VGAAAKPSAAVIASCRAPGAQLGVPLNADSYGALVGLGRKAEGRVFKTRYIKTAYNNAAAAAYRPAKPLDNTDFDLSWRKQMTRVYVKAALEELRRRG